MALSLASKIYLGSNYDVVTFQETTGTYDASTNTGGWGSPNPDPSGTTPASTGYLTVTHEWDEVTFDDITIVPSATIADTTIALTSFEVDGTDYFTTKLTDGIYTFVYKVTISGTDYTHTTRKLILPDLWCTLTTLGKKIANSSCGCSSGEFVTKWLEGFARLIALEGSAVCGDDTAVEAEYTSLKNYLSTLKCNC